MKYRKLVYKLRQMLAVAKRPRARAVVDCARKRHVLAK